MYVQKGKERINARRQLQMNQSDTAPRYIIHSSSSTYFATQSLNCFASRMPVHLSADDHAIRFTDFERTNMNGMLIIVTSCRARYFTRKHTERKIIQVNICR